MNKFSMNIFKKILLLAISFNYHNLVADNHKLVATKKGYQDILFITEVDSKTIRKDVDKIDSFLKEHSLESKIIQNYYENNPDKLYTGHREFLKNLTTNSSSKIFTETPLLIRHGKQKQKEYAYLDYSPYRFNMIPMVIFGKLGNFYSCYKHDLLNFNVSDVYSYKHYIQYGAQLLGFVRSTVTGYYFWGMLSTVTRVFESYKLRNWANIILYIIKGNILKDRSFKVFKKEKKSFRSYSIFAPYTDIYSPDMGEIQKKAILKEAKQQNCVIYKKDSEDCPFARNMVINYLRYLTSKHIKHIPIKHNKHPITDAMFLKDIFYIAEQAKISSSLYNIVKQFVKSQNKKSVMFVVLKEEIRHGFNNYNVNHYIHPVSINIDDKTDADDLKLFNEFNSRLKESNKETATKLLKSINNQLNVWYLSNYFYFNSYDNGYRGYLFAFTVDLCDLKKYL